MSVLLALSEAEGSRVEVTKLGLGDRSKIFFTLRKYFDNLEETLIRKGIGDGRRTGYLQAGERHKPIEI
jgi:hypothetical protein